MCMRYSCAYSLYFDPFFFTECPPLTLVTIYALEFILSDPHVDTAALLVTVCIAYIFHCLPSQNIKIAYLFSLLPSTYLCL